MAKAKGSEPLIQNYPLGSMPVFALCCICVGTAIYGIPGTVITAVIASAGIYLMVRKDIRMTNESVARVSNYLSANYGLYVNQDELKDYCEDLARKPYVNIRAKELNTGNTVVHTLKFNDDFTQIEVPSIKHEPEARVRKRFSLFRR